jgi:ATP-binding cassette subfamily A (ABC1) protein 3
MAQVRVDKPRNEMKKSLIHTTILALNYYPFYPSHPAGKTTTMQMLTAEFPPSGGDATLAGFSVLNEPEKTRRRIGYCPQFDAHFANLTGREHVELFASIKGVPIEFVKEASAAKLAEVGLSDFDSDKLCVGYSGGMKRRLSLACALIGQPQLVFLDGKYSACHERY